MIPLLYKIMIHTNKHTQDINCFPKYNLIHVYIYIHTEEYTDKCRKWKKKYVSKSVV